MNACPRCSSSVPSDGRFCPRCSEKLEGERLPSATAPEGSGGAAAQRTSGMAVAGLIFSLVPVCLHVVGLVLGIVALVRIGRRPQELKGRGMAQAAVIIGSLWTVVAAVGILAAIAIPNFVMFEGRSKQSEAKANLKRLYVGWKSFESESGNPPGSFEDMQFQPEGGRRYAYFIESEVLQPDRGGPYELAQSPVHFDQDDPPLAIAVGNLDSDDTLDVWELREDGVPRVVVDDFTQ